MSKSQKKNFRDIQEQIQINQKKVRNRKERHEKWRRQRENE